jgi:hypothetical protein
VEVALDLIKAYGPPGLLAVFLYVALFKSEQREAKKDLRIQLLENQLRESYDERILAADKLSDALHGNATALTSLTNEIRSSHVKHH